MNQPHEVTVSAGPGSVSSNVSPALLLGLSSLAYFLAQVLAFKFPESFGLVAAIWPASGIALASLLLCPRHRWLPLLACLFAAGITANLTTERPLLASAGFMVANISETAAAAWLITRFCSDRVAFNRVREVIALAGAAILVNAATALIGAQAARLAIGANFGNFYWTWWIADGLGLLLITPLIVSWTRAGPTLARLPWRTHAEAAFLLGLSGAVAAMEFGWTTEFSAIELAPFWLPVLLIWAALRFGPLVTVTVLGVFALIAVGCTAAGLGTFPLGGGDATLRLQSVQCYLAVMGLTGLVVATAVAQQKQSQTLLRAVVEGTSDAIYVKDRQGRYLLFNSAAARFAGKAAADVIGRDDTCLFPPAEAKGLQEIDQIAMAADQAWTYEEHLTGGGGKELDFFTTKGPLHDESGAVIGLFGVARDITERKRTDTALRHSEEWHRTIIETAINGFWLTDTEGRILEVNEAYCRMSGYRAPELLKMRIADVEASESVEETLAHIRKVMASGEDRFESKLRHKDGRIFEVEINVQYRPVDGGRLVVFVQDITARKLADTALRESEEKFAKVFRRAPVLIVLTDIEKGNCIEVNEEVLRLSGFTREEVIGRTVVELGWLTAEERAQLVQAVLLHGRVDDLEKTFRKKTGELRQGLVNAESMIIGGRPCLLTVTVDISEHKRMEAAVRESEEKFAKAFRDSPVPMAIRDLETDLYLDANDRCLAMMGYDRAEVIGHSPMEIGWMTEADRETNLQSLTTTGSVADRELRLRRKDGATVICSYNTHVIQIGGRSCVLSTSIDITERKQAEMELQKTRAILQVAMDQSPAGIAIADAPTGALRYVNDAGLFIRGGDRATVVSGIDLNQYVGSWQLLDLDGRPLRTEEVPLARAVMFGETNSREFFIRRAEGDQRLVLANAAPIRDEAGKVVAGVVVFIDITELKRTEQALREEQISMRALMENIPDRIYFKDRAHRFLRVNLAQAQLLGASSPVEVVGKTDADFFVGEHARQAAADEADIMQTGQTMENIEERETWPDGSVTWVMSTKLPLRDDKGRIVGTCGISRDITKRKQAEEALRTSEQRYRSILNASPDDITIADLAGRILIVSPSGLKMFGYEREEEFLHRPVTDSLAPEDRAVAASRIALMLQGVMPSVNQYRGLRRDGTTFDMEVNSDFIRDATGQPTHIIFVARDITARKQAEAALATATDRLSLATRAGGVGIWEFDVRNNRLIWDDEMYRLYGITPDQFEGAYAAWQNGVHPDDRARSDAEVQSALRGEKEFDTEFRVLWPDGSVHYIRALSLVKRDAAGQPLNIVGTNWDITAQKQAESALQSSLHEKEALLKEVHHRVKNNLQVITSLLRLESGRSKQPSTQSVLEDMQGRIRSMAMLHEALYRSGTFAAVDLGVYLKQITTQLYRALVATPGAIQLQLDLTAVPIEMDQAMPCGLLVNELVSNAFKHGFPNGRTGEVRVELHRVAGGPQLRLCVSDTGVGLPANLESRRSQSLGLQLVGDLARQVDGILETGSGPGTSFTITFTPRLHAVGSNPPIKAP